MCIKVGGPGSNLFIQCFSLIHSKIGISELFADSANERREDLPTLGICCCDGNPPLVSEAGVNTLWGAPQRVITNAAVNRPCQVVIHDEGTEKCQRRFKLADVDVHSLSG